MNLAAIQLASADPRPRHDLPRSLDVLAQASTYTLGDLIEAQVVSNRARSRFWLTRRQRYGDVQTWLGAAETESMGRVKEWLRHFDLHELSIAGTVVLFGRCPIERVQRHRTDVAAVRSARREMMARH